jgi:hypothetical protein
LLLLWFFGLKNMRMTAAYAHSKGAAVQKHSTDSPNMSSDNHLQLPQWWANLDQAPKDLDKTIFRDLSPTPIP